jgi:hypothetical protein
MSDQLDRFYRHREYVRCRTFGHAWDDIPVTESHQDGYSWWLRCVNCTTERHDVIDRRYGYLLHRQYVYPDHYSLAGEMLPTRDEFRLRLIDIAQRLSDRRERKREPAHAAAS